HDPELDVYRSGAPTADPRPVGGPARDPESGPPLAPGRRGRAGPVSRRVRPQVAQPPVPGNVPAAPGAGASGLTRRCTRRRPPVGFPKVQTAGAAPAGEVGRSTAGCYVVRRGGDDGPAEAAGAAAPPVRDVQRLAPRPGRGRGVPQGSRVGHAVRV